MIQGVALISFLSAHINPGVQPYVVAPGNQTSAETRKSTEWV